jgi:serine/threonine protein kinase
MQASDPHSSSAREPSQGESLGTGEPPWELIAERIDAFAAAWDASRENRAAPPDLAAHVADLDPATARQVLLELIKLDMERRGQHQLDPQPIEWYAKQLAPLGPVGKLPVDVIYEELQARMLGGRPVYREEVVERFPVQADALLRLLGGLALSGSPTATYFADTIVEGQAAAPKTPIVPKGPPFAHLQSGDTLDDFQLLSPLGSGAFARVFLARQKSMERLVALKISTHAGSEPQTLAQLDHPHIVRVYDQRTVIEPPAKLLYMEVVSGGTLQDVIARTRHAYDGKPSGDLLLASIDEKLAATGTPVPESSSSRAWIEDASWPEIVCRIGAELADGLAYAHGRGVMHRDIKPANVLLSAEGRPKLADFNVSYNGGRADENPEDTFGGSLAYMSPEQLEACHPLLGGSPRSVREQSDVYAIGVLLWELLCGRRPFRDEAVPADGGSLLRLQRMIDVRRGTDFDVLGQQLPSDCPASLRGVLERCLQADKDKRIKSAGDLARELRLCLNPRCWQLLQPPTDPIGKFIWKWPVLSGVLAGLVPNAITARFNLLYNRARIPESWPKLLKPFEETQIVINIIAFTIGIVGGAWLSLRAVRFVKSKVNEPRPYGSGQVFGFSLQVSALVLTLWTACGLVFPIAVAWNHPEGVGARFYVHFFLSLALCGFAATAYPYFLITSGIVRYFIPAMIRNGSIEGPRRRDLDRIKLFNRLHMLLAGLVPLLGVLLIVLFGNTQIGGAPPAASQAEQQAAAADSKDAEPKDEASGGEGNKEDEPDDKQDAAEAAEEPPAPSNFLHLSLVAVSGGGLIGIAVTAWLWRRIEQDAAALAHLAIDERRMRGVDRSSAGRTSRRSARS